VESHRGADLERLAYELSAAALARQESALDELRGRAGTLLAASSLVASFLGGQVVAQPTGPFAIGALTVFVISVAATLNVLVPRRSLIFGLRGSVLVAAERERPVGLAETYRRLARWTERYIDGNERVVNRLSRSFQIATGAVVAQVLFWVVEVI